MIHFKYGGSTAKRTINCPGWKKLCKGIPQGPESPAAALGTALHDLFEKSLNDYDYDPYEAIDTEVEGVMITADHITDKVYPAIDAFDELWEKEGLDTLHAETLMKYDENIGGSADIIAWGRDTFLIGDLKTGDGVMVYAENNEQMMFYAWLALEHYADTRPRNSQIKRVLLAIIQPSDRRENILDVWETDIDTVEAFKQRFLKAVKDAESGHGMTCPGSHCAFCPATPVCPQKTGLVAASRRIDAKSTEMQSLTDGMAIVEDVEKWCRAIRKLAHEQADEGVKIPGWKLVNKRASRVFNDAPAVEQKLKNMRKLTAPDYYVQKLVSPPQLEKICKQKKVDFKQFAEYISSVSSGTTLAHDDDKRPEAIPLGAMQAMAQVGN